MPTWTKLGSIALAAACVAGLSACTTYVDTQVTAFSKWQDGALPHTYAFSHQGLKPQDELEESAYETIVDGELERAGFHNEPLASAHYLVKLDWGMREAQMTTMQPVIYDDPMLFGPRRFWAGDPFGPWGPEFVPVTYPVFDQMLVLRISERASGHQVYQVTAVNRSDTPNLLGDMPYLAHAALAGFPLANGQTHVVRVKLAKPGHAIAPQPASGVVVTQ